MIWNLQVFLIALLFVDGFESFGDKIGGQSNYRSQIKWSRGIVHFFLECFLIETTGQYSEDGVRWG